jgi:predicted DCC family thiol-disulfide oxidoreductase YuxK
MSRTESSSGETGGAAEDGRYAVLLFDGVCNLCNGWVDFVIRREPAGTIRFAALQSTAGRQWLQQASLPVDYLESLILVDEEGRVFSGSDGVLQTLRRLRQPWPLLYGLNIIPLAIRNFVYEKVANRRYSWFGKRETCRLPTDEERERFL